MFYRYTLTQRPLLRCCKFVYTVHGTSNFATLSSSTPTLSSSYNFQPSIRKNPFTPNTNTQASQDQPVDILRDLDTTTENSRLSNPLNNDNINAIEIPTTTNEQDTIPTAEIINRISEIIVTDTKRATQLYKGVKDKSKRKLIGSELIKFFRSDKVKLSIWRYIIDPRGRITRMSILNVLNSILDTSDKLNGMKIEILLNYLHKLSATNNINTDPLLLSSKKFHDLLRLVPSEKHVILYLYMVQLNIQPAIRRHMDGLKKKLINESAKARFVAQTGYFSPKWHELTKTQFNETKRLQMVNFFAITDFERFAQNSIKHNQPAMALYYLNCMLTKFERKCLHGAKVVDNTTTEQDIQMLLKTVLNLVMKFKGGSHGIDVLKYMNSENLRVTFDLYLSLLQNLRQSENYNEFAMVLNHLPLEELSYEQKVTVGVEILAMMQSRFPTSPKVIIGYVGALFNGSDASKNQGLVMLNELQLLDIPFGAGGVAKIPSVDIVQIATIHSQLKGLSMTHGCLPYIYNVTLDSVDNILESPELVWQLYERYLQFVQSSRLDITRDDVITTFLDHLLRTGDGSSFPVTPAIENYRIAKKITKFYYTVPDIKISSLNIELLIQTALLIHKDYSFALEILKLSRQRGNPFTFNQIYPFIKYHYDNKDYSEARVWYNELVKLGAGSTGIMLSELFGIAKELGWPVNSCTFKFNLTKRKRHNKEALDEIQKDSAMFIEKSNIDTTGNNLKVTTNNDNNDFENELASILQSLNQKLASS